MTTTSPAGGPTPESRSDVRQRALPPLTAALSSSVGTTWTVVLRRSEDSSPPAPTVAWVGTGIPITEAAPVQVARALLAEHGYSVVGDSSGTGSRTTVSLGRVAPTRRRG